MVTLMINIFYDFDDELDFNYIYSVTQAYYKDIIMKLFLILPK